MRFVWLTAILMLGCGSSGPAWKTYHSASCDSTFDLIELPASNRVVENTYYGDSVATAHGIDRADGSRLVYGCRFIPQPYWASKAEQDVAREVLAGELSTFDATWIRGEVAPKPDGSLEIAMTHPGGKAELRMRGVANEGRTHGSIVKDATPADHDRFLAGIHIDPPHATGPVTVRSAECLSSVVMPGWPTGELAPPYVTHRFIEAQAREWQLRCVFLTPQEMKLTPAELFAQAEKDTIANGALVLVDKHDVDVGGHPGRDMRFETPDKSRALQLRMTIDGDRVQAATFFGPVGETAPAKRFIESLRLLRPRP